MKIFSTFIVAFFLSFTTQAALAPGFYKGKNPKAWIWRNCSIQVNQYNNQVTALSISDGLSQYNYFLYYASVKKSETPELFSVSDQFRFVYQGADGKMIYDNYQGANFVGTLAIKTNADGSPTEFNYSSLEMGSDKVIDMFTCGKIEKLFSL